MRSLDTLGSVLLVVAMGLILFGVQLIAVLILIATFSVEGLPFVIDAVERLTRPAVPRVLADTARPDQHKGASS